MGCEYKEGRNKDEWFFMPNSRKSPLDSDCLHCASALSLFPPSSIKPNQLNLGDMQHLRDLIPVHIPGAKHILLHTGSHTL